MPRIGRIVSAFSVAALALGGSLVVASQANAVGGCASDGLCVYSGANFTGSKITTRSTNSCFSLYDGIGGPFENGRIVSYVNNLSVVAYIWDYNYTNKTWSKSRTLPSGGFSSDIRPNGLGFMVCQGSAHPSNF
ncbi:peptidase inhibitor family I36 protein [Streptomyces sp. NPDC001455]|uniref:peptidase inhibitor family I36 protein n=1 Tax=unclassified Streptomyces TaxID=2593676 RepID=UPI0033297160